MFYAARRDTAASAATAATPRPSAVRMGSGAPVLFRRNTVALDIDTWSGQTGHAVAALVTLEAAALIRTALDARQTRRNRLNVSM